MKFIKTSRESSLSDELLFLLRLAPAGGVVKAYHPAKLVYSLTNIQLEYQAIHTKNDSQMRPCLSRKTERYSYTSRSLISREQQWSKEVGEGTSSSRV